MESEDQKEQHHVLSDVSSDDDARELANLGKKPVLRVSTLSITRELG